jgi:SOS-response transcriptional repressor LexA
MLPSLRALESTRGLAQRMRAIEDRQIERRSTGADRKLDVASQASIQENSTESAPISSSRAAINAALEAARQASKMAGKTQPKS